MLSPHMPCVTGRA